MLQTLYYKFEGFLFVFCADVCSMSPVQAKVASEQLKEKRHAKSE